MKNVTIKILLTTALLKPISESPSLHKLSATSENASYIQRRDWADVSPDVSEAFYERLSQSPVAAIHSGVPLLFIQQKNKNCESDFNALIVSCGENAFALSALHFAV